MKPVILFACLLLLNGCAAAVPFGVGAVVGTAVTQHNQQPVPNVPPRPAY
jgi:hypothetical protein